MNKKQAKKELETIKSKKRLHLSTISLLENDFNAGRISYKSYITQLNQILKDRSYMQWLIYYDNQIKRYQSVINTAPVIFSRNILLFLFLLLLIIPSLLLFEPAANLIQGAAITDTLLHAHVIENITGLDSVEDSPRVVSPFSKTRNISNNIFVKSDQSAGS